MLQRAPGKEALSESVRGQRSRSTMFSGWGGQDGEARTVSHGERIAQIVFTPFESATFNVVEELSETVRGAGGFGSTGSK